MERHISTQQNSDPKQKVVRYVEWGLFGLSLVWAVALGLFSGLASIQPAFWVTVAFIALNFLWSVTILWRQRRFSILLTCIQPLLFCWLSYLLFVAWGTHHYRFEHSPELRDWIQLTLVHLVRASDVFDTFEAYGIYQHNLQVATNSAGIILVLLHVVVDLFFLGLLYRLLSLCWQAIKKSTESRNLNPLAWMLFGVSILAMLITAAAQGWSEQDTGLWFVENLARVVDFPELFQIYHWKWHGLETTFWMASIAALLRTSFGVLLAQGVNAIRLRFWPGFLRGDNEIFKDSFSHLAWRRHGAIKVWKKDQLRTSKIVSRLIELQTDEASSVRQESNEALELIDPNWRVSNEAADSVQFLYSELDSHLIEVQRAAAVSLGEMRGRAKLAIPALVVACTDEDSRIQPAFKEALMNILRGNWESNNEHDEVIKSLIKLMAGNESKIRVLARKVADRVHPEWWQTDAAKASLTHLSSRMHYAPSESVRKVSEAIIRLIETNQGHPKSKTRSSSKPQPVKSDLEREVGTANVPSDPIPIEEPKGLTPSAPAPYVSRKAKKKAKKKNKGVGNKTPRHSEQSKDSGLFPVFPSEHPIDPPESDNSETEETNEIQRKSDFQQVMTSLKDKKAVIRREAVGSLGRFRGYSGQYLPRLVKLLADEDARVRELAEAHVLVLGLDTVPYLLGNLDYADEQVSARIHHLLQSLGEEAIPLILDCLTDPTPQVQEGAALALESMPHVETEVVPYLIVDMKHRRAEVRQAAVTITGRLGPKAVSAKASLQKCLTDRHAGVRKAAEVAIGLVVRNT